MRRKEEKPKSRRTKAKAGRKRHPIRALILSIVVVLTIVAAAAVFLYVMKVETVYVKGNYYADPSSVIRKIMPEENDYRLYRVLWNMVFGVRTDEALSSCSVALTDIKSLEITVRETEAVAYVEKNGTHVFLNDQGYVVGTGTGNTDLLPEIMGLSSEPVLELEKLKVNRESDLMDALMLVRALSLSDLRATMIYVEDGVLSAYFGEITASFGKNTHLIEKASELSAQFSHFKGLSGVIHLEVYEDSPNGNRFYFEVKP